MNQTRKRATFEALNLAACLKGDGTYPVKDQGNHQLSVSGGFLIFALLFSLIIIPVRKFNAGRFYGIFLCVVYLMYVSVALTLEFAVKK